jgi:hypothetical protein
MSMQSFRSPSAIMLWLLALILGVTITATVKIPVFVSMYQELGGELPRLTVFIFFTYPWLWIAPIGSLLVIALDTFGKLKRRVAYLFQALIGIGVLVYGLLALIGLYSPMFVISPLLE